MLYLCSVLTIAGVIPYRKKRKTKKNCQIAPGETEKCMSKIQRTLLRRILRTNREKKLYNNNTVWSESLSVSRDFIKIK
jgi:hypothetical protein